jgi:HK97 family phage portal protein
VRILPFRFPFLTKAQPAPVETKSLDDVPWFFGSLPTFAGPPVNHHSAMQVPAVAAAVQLISEAVGTLPAKTFERQGNGKLADPEHPAYRIVHDRANPWTSAGELRTQLTADAQLHDHGGFALAVRVGNDRHVAEFHRLEPTSVSVKCDQNTGEPIYLVSDQNGQTPHSYRDVLHIRPFGGRAPINRARETIGNSLAIEKFVGTFIKNGARPSGVLSIPDKQVGDTAIENIKKMWREVIGGGDNTGTPAVLTGGMTWGQQSLNFVDSQLLETWQYHVEQISRAFLVPPPLLNDFSRATWGNYEQAVQQFLTGTIRPWLEKWVAAYSCVLLPDDDTSHFIEFIVDDLLSVDFATRATAYAQYRAMGAMTANEVRAGLNLPATPDGDKLENPYTTPANTKSPAGVA